MGGVWVWGCGVEQGYKGVKGTLGTAAVDAVGLGNRQGGGGR